MPDGQLTIMYGRFNGIISQSVVYVRSLNQPELHFFHTQLAQSGVGQRLRTNNKQAPVFSISTCYFQLAPSARRISHKTKANWLKVLRCNVRRRQKKAELEEFVGILVHVINNNSKGQERFTTCKTVLRYPLLSIIVRERKRRIVSSSRTRCKKLYNKKHCFRFELYKRTAEILLLKPTQARDLNTNPGNVHAPVLTTVEYTHRIN